MTRDEFLALPVTVALRVLLDAAPQLADRLAALPLPELPKKPKYDAPIYRKDGVQWASESDLGSLRYWRDKYAESGAGGGQYADKDARKAKALDAWVAWRIAEPSAVWTGVRNDADVMAAPPSRWAKVHERGRRVERDEAASTADDESAGGDDDIPF